MRGLSAVFPFRRDHWSAPDGTESEVARTDGGPDSRRETSSRTLLAVGAIVPDRVRGGLLPKALVGLVLIICLTGLIAGYFYVGISDDLEEQVDRQVVATTKLHASAYDDWFADRKSELAALAKEVELSDADREGISELLRKARIDNEHVRHFHYVSTESGEIVASSNRAAIGDTVASPQSLARERQFVLSSQFTTVEGRSGFAMGQNVPFEDFVIIAEFDLDEAGPSLEQPVRGATTSVVTRNGESVIGPTDGTVPANLDDGVTVVRAEGAIRGYQPLSSVDLLVVTNTPRDSAFVIRDAILQSFVLTILLTFLVLVGATVVWGRSIIRDVMALAAGVQRMRDGNLEVELDTDRDDEIGQLYQGVASMRDSLRERISELEEARIEAETARREAEARQQELERQNERLEKFASVVSHDLRSPLTVAEARIELAQEECDSDHLDRADDAIERSQALIEDILTLAREGDSVSDLTDVDLAMAAENCWGRVATSEATLATDIDHTIRADESRLQQLLTNLIRNAVEHGAEDGTVTVGTLEDGFYVADDGPGIPEGDRETVFEHGYSTADQGTGYGLAIVEEIAEAHGWAVSLTESERGGARFEIRGVEFASQK